MIELNLIPSTERDRPRASSRRSGRWVGAVGMFVAVLAVIVLKSRPDPVPSGGVSPAPPDRPVGEQVRPDGEGAGAGVPGVPRVAASAPDPRAPATSASGSSASDSSASDSSTSDSIASALAARLRALEEFDRTRNDVVRVLDLVADALPGDVRLVAFTTLATDPLAVELNGRASGPEGLLAFMTRLRARGNGPAVALLAARSVLDEVPSVADVRPVPLLAFDLSLAPGVTTTAAGGRGPVPAASSAGERLAELESRLEVRRDGRLEGQPEGGSEGRREAPRETRPAGLAGGHGWLPSLEARARALAIEVHGLAPVPARPLDVHTVEGWTLQVVGRYRAVRALVAGLAEEGMARVAAASMVPLAGGTHPPGAERIEATLVVERVVAGNAPDVAGRPVRPAAPVPVSAPVPVPVARGATPARDPFALPPAHRADAPDPGSLRLEGIAWDPDPRRRLALVGSGTGVPSPAVAGSGARVRVLRVGERWGDVQVLAIRGGEAELGIGRFGVVERRVLRVTGEGGADAARRGPR